MKKIDRRELFTAVIAVLSALLFAAGCGSSGTAKQQADEEDETIEIADEQPQEADDAEKCVKDEKECRENNAVVKCDANGNWIWQTNCDGDYVCFEGRCVDKGEVEFEDEAEPEIEEEKASEPESADGDIETYDPEPEQDLPACEQGTLRCRNNNVEKCGAGGISWTLVQKCNECQVCDIDHCKEVGDCDVQPEPELESEKEKDPEPIEEEKPWCSAGANPAYCQGSVLTACNEQNGEMESMDCAQNYALCMVCSDGTPRCVGQEGAYCDDGDPWGCLPGLGCEDNFCVPPKACKDVKDLQEGDNVGSTMNAADDLGHEAGTCAPRPLFGFDNVYRFNLGANRMLEAELTGTNISSGAIYVITDCMDGAACAQGVTYVDGAYKKLRFLAPQTGSYYLVVDSDNGYINYTLKATFMQSSACNIKAVVEANAELAGSTCAAGANFNPGPSCRYGSLKDAPGEEVYYMIKVPANSAVTAKLQTFTAGADGVIYALSDCSAPTCEIGIDAYGANMAEEVKVGTASARAAIIVVDGKDKCFDYTLSIRYELYGGCDAAPFASPAIFWAALTAAIFLGRRMKRTFAKK